MVYSTTGTSSATCEVWINWNDTSTATNTTSSATDNEWAGWCYATTAATTSTACQVWGKWTVRYNTPKQLTPEAIEERRQRAVAEQKRQEEIEAQRKAAEERAAELLMEHLDEDQLAAFKEYRKFHVLGSDGARYEIECTKRMHNIFQLDDKGERTQELCVYQTGDTPLADNALAQKLALETNAPALRKIANKWDYKTRKVLSA